MVHSSYRHISLLGLIPFTTFQSVAARLRQRSDIDASSSIIESSSRSLSPIEQQQEHLHEGGEEPPHELPHETVSLIAQQFTEDPYAHRDRYEMIMNGELGLSSIRFAPSSFAADDGGDDFTEVYGEFCVYDSTLNKQDPSTYSTVHDIMGTSEHCGEHRYMMPLREVVTAVTKYDSSRKSNMRQLPVSGLLFHEGYSGAGLISNALATFDSTLVIAEHPAIRDALSACDVIRNRYKIDDCSSDKQQRLVQDVITLLSRTHATSSIQHLYLKLSSQSSAYLPELRSLYPDAKWAFVYRNADHALAKATQRKRSGVCMKARRNPSMALSTKSTEYNIDLEALSHHEVCALHLSTLLDAAFKEHDESGTGMLISYDDVILDNKSNAIVDDILPYLGMSKEIDANPQDVRERVSEILSLRSNSSRNNKQRDKKWNGESIQVSDEIGIASKMFMSDSMDAIARL